MLKHFGMGGWVAAGALAAVAMFAPSRVQAQNITYSEVYLGVLAHDVHFLGGKEHGIDINPEFIFASPIDDATMMSVPALFRWMVQPRPTIGAAINTSGYTNQAYLGATWTWLLTHDVFRADDGISFGIFFGPSINDGKLHSNQDDRKNLGANILFRESFELGYKINPVWTVSAYLDHISNGGLAKYNQSINNFGGRIGFKF